MPLTLNKPNPVRRLGENLRLFLPTILPIISPTSLILADVEKKPLVVSPAQEIVWGEKTLEAFLEENPQSQDGDLIVHVDDIGRRFVPVSDRPEALSQFLVVQREELQGFSFPNGTVCLSESLARLFPNDDELAFVIGHEWAHIVLRHHIAQLRMDMALRSDDVVIATLLNVIKSSLDRDLEVEADRFGALYSVRAGFKYSSTYKALERLSQATPGLQEDARHPDYLERMEALKAFRPELERSLEAFRFGSEALQKGEVDEAISKLRIFVAEFPNSVSGRINLGAAHLGRYRLYSGTPHGLSEVLPILPEPDIVLRGLPNISDLKHALENFEQALQIQPGEVFARAGLGLVHTRMGKYDEARNDFNQARIDSPARPEFPLCLGNVDFLTEDFQGAALLYQEALSIQPEWPDAIRNLALTYEELGQHLFAMNLWSTLLSDEKYGREARQRLASLAVKVEED